VVILPQDQSCRRYEPREQIRMKVESKKLVKKSTGDILVRLRFQSASRNIIQAKRGRSLLAPMRVCTRQHGGRNRVASKADGAAQASARPNRKDSGFGFVPCRHDDDGFAAAAGLV